VTESLASRLRELLDRTFGRKIGRASVFGLMRDPVVLLDASDAIVDVNPAFERRLAEAVVAAPPSEPPGTATATDAAAHQTDGDGSRGRAARNRRVRNPALDRAVGDALPDLAAALDGPRDRAGVLLAGALDGWAATIETLLDRRGRRLGRTVILRDVRAERAREKRLRYQADRDPLTGALNRRAFNALLAQALADAGARVTLAYLDLDGFKDLNDFYGHATGDAVLIETTARLSRVLRDEDALGRMGGDEFAVALVGLDRVSADPIVARLRNALEPLHEVHSATIRIEASLGVASAPEDGRDAQALLSAADAAMYRAKAARRAAAIAAVDPVGGKPPGGGNPPS
jgi:diguanylate cyclase (GGDEF)-like protein